MLPSALSTACCLLSVAFATAFQPSPTFAPPQPRPKATDGASGTALRVFGKMFEEEGPLGKGITVGMVQVALQANDRGSSSVFGMMEKAARNAGETEPELAEMANEVCISLLRKSDEWIGACSQSQWFSEKDAGKAESFYNELSNKEASKFEKDYIPGAGSDEKAGGPTQVVVSLVIEIQGDNTKFEGAGFSLSGTKEVLSSIAADCLVDEGYCMNAVEIFWTPSESTEVLSKTDLIVDFPELIDL
eukprot:CAMPEP_0113596782 /NCGR_PEP_ID=MMETSP0015_2-20120614/40545_1 /TAXON_ID=2838 /ORGANISM="Odontella" /LENGTH=245 /DNA_ID=CAMNT_0000504371 /DNA_START=153 /DNA_END=890 /DNA_ORIENTATION=- /assembly_acc=CAM_ASM_000160